jgi:hypothetical protein
MAKGRETTTENGRQWLSLRAASEEAGVSVSTLRNWYRKGLIEVRSEQDRNGTRKLVRRDEVLARSRASERARRPGDSNGVGNESSPSDALWTDLIRELGETHERAGRAEAKVEQLSRQLAKGSRPSADDPRLEILEKENRLLREELGRARDQVRELVSRLGPEAGSEELFEEESELPEEDYLALTERWRERRRRKKAERRRR